MCNRKDVLRRSEKTCALATIIFINNGSFLFAYVVKEREHAAAIFEMKSLSQNNSIVDYLHEEIV